MMQSFPKTMVLRHRRENLKKCSLRGLEPRSDFIFLTYPTSPLPDIKGFVLLAMDGPPLTIEDQNKSLFLLDATWRHAEKMREFVDREVFARQIKIEIRSIPQGFKTAYPRRQDDCPDPEEGLASVEALYIAYKILDRDTTGLLDTYHWKEEFLLKNKF